MENWRTRAKEALRDARIRQEDLAEQLGISQGALSHWLSGRRDPGLDQICALARALGIEPQVMIFGAKADLWPFTVSREQVLQLKETHPGALDAINRYIQFTIASPASPSADLALEGFTQNQRTIGDLNIEGSIPLSQSLPGKKQA